MKAKTLIKHSGGFILFGTKSLSPQDLVKSGRDMTNTWLKLNTEGIQCQPYNWGILPALIAAKVGEQCDLTDKNKDFYLKHFSQIQELSKNNQLPVFMLRIGYGDFPKTKTLRRENQISA